jgi:hypothetical protein
MYTGKLVYGSKAMRYEIRDAKGELFAVLTKEYSAGINDLTALCTDVVKFCTSVKIKLFDTQY